jgi:hypothetical protein
VLEVIIQTLCKNCGKAIPVVYIDNPMSIFRREKMVLIQEYCSCCKRKLKLGKRNGKGGLMGSRNHYKKWAKWNKTSKKRQNHIDRMKVSAPKLYNKYIETLRKKYSR